MIIYFAQGQLGNQLFQYSFINSISDQDEIVCVLGFDEFLSIFDVNRNIIKVTKNNFTKYLKIFRYFFEILSTLKIISSFKPIKVHLIDEYVKESTEIDYNKGLFKKIKFVKTASYESEDHFCYKIKNEFRIKKKYVLKAQNFLNDYQNYNKVFVHIRLGDYEDYTALGKSVKIPIKYYKKVIKKIYSEVEDPLFVFLSNKPDVIRKHFKDVEHKLISLNDFGTDFAIMTICDYGIMSASTFSFWGAYLMKNRKKVYAPKYWKGFNSNIEYPINGFPSFAEPISVNM